MIRKSQLTKLVTFYDETTDLVGKRREWMLFILTQKRF